ncbi:hypothetical protein EDB89DRAFT_1972647, partial [Lactarius sanguifluus]
MFHTVQAIINHTRWNWCNKKVGNIWPGPGHPSAITLAITHKAAKPFWNSGWVHLESVSGVMPSMVQLLPVISFL